MDIREYSYVVFDLGSANINHLKREVRRRVNLDGKARTLYVKGVEWGRRGDHRKDRAIGGWAILTDEDKFGGNIRNWPWTYRLECTGQITRNML